MLAVEDLAGIAERLAQLTVDVQLVLDPQRTGHEERPVPGRRDAEIRLEDALELEERLVVEADVGEVGDGDAGHSEAVLDRPRRKRGITLLAGEPLLLPGGDDLPVADQTRRAVVVERRESEDVRIAHAINGLWTAP